MLKAQKAEVSSFAEYAKTLSSVKLNTEELLAEKEYIKSLYGILQKLKIDNPLMAEIGRYLHLFFTYLHCPLVMTTISPLLRVQISFIPHD